MSLRLLAVVFSLFLVCAESARAEALRVLLLPFTNTVALMKVHQPLRQHLQDQLGQEVELYTSADFVSHFNEIRAGAFDLAITGPHFGAWAVDHGQVPLVRYRPPLRPLLVVRRDGGITSVAQLRGKTVALSNRLSISSIAGEGWLTQQGLQADRDYRLTVSPTHTAAIMGVAMGEVDAAITTHTPVQQAPQDIRDKITELPTDAAVPHLFTIASNRLPAARVQQIRAALMSFGQTPGGAAFFSETAYEAYVPLTENDVATMRPYVDLLLRILPQ